MAFSRRSFVGAVCAVGATVSVAAAERPLTLPRRLYTPETIAGLKAKPARNPLGLTLWSAREAPGLAALKARSLDDLDRFIPLTPPTAMWSAEGLCPFCGARWALKGRSYIDMMMGRAYEDILNDPYALTTACCNLRIPEDEADWPTGGRWATRNTIAVPHLDGVTRAYAFLVPPSDVGKAFATVPVRKGRDTWFCPAMDVWNRRMVCLRERLIPSLAAVALKNRDAATRAAARRLLVRIFARLAEVLPRGTVCQSSVCDLTYGLAKDRGKRRYLTAADYRATPRYRRPDWQDGSYYTLGVFGSSATGNWQNGTFAAFARLLEAWDVVRDSAEAQPFAAQIQKGVVDELGFCLSWSLPSQGNTEYVWYDAATRVAVALQDPWYLNFAIDRIRDTGISEVYADGLVTEGALRPYAGLVCNNFRFVDRLRAAGICDLYAELPRVEHAAARTEQACRTLWGGTVSPGDDMAQGWLPSTAAWGGKPSEKPDYGRFRGENYPDWGLLMLRCGGVSNRLEICMDNAKHDGHGHNARLNLELFYEGTPLMPELGYCQTTLAYDRGFGLELKERYARERGLPFCAVPKPNPSHPGQWGLWYAYGNMDLTHVSAAVDWTQLGPYGRRDYAAWTPRFATAESPDGPEGFAQFAEGALDSLGRAYRRQLAAITLPSGGALALDFYRLAGGRRHQTFAHAFAPKADEPVAYAGLDLKPAPFADYAAYAAANGCDLQTNAAYSARAVFYPYLRDLRTAASGDAAWRMTFRCRPGAYAPLTDAGRAFFDAWVPKAVPDVDFDLWGASAGSPAATQVLTMKGPNVIRQQEKASHPRGYQGYLIPFDGLLDIVSEVRTAPTDGLKSCFARVYSPRRAEGQAPAVRRVEPLGEGAVKVETADGTLYAAATESDTGRFVSGGFALTGRFGAVLPDRNLIRLYDGESVALEAGGRIWRAKVAPTQRLRLRKVVGDVSGRPQEHALIVAGGDLPTDGTWKGRWITVEHPGCRMPSDSYEVAAISRIADGVYRVDLAEKPTFVTFRAKVSSIERQADGSVVYKADRWNNKEEHAKGFGGRIHFTRTGWTPDYAIVAAKGRGGAYRVEATPPDGQAPRVGDVFTLSRIRAGDTVVFPSSLAARGRDDGRGGVAFEVVATGPYEVSAQAAPFADGDRIVFWGDSITHGGFYPQLLSDFYLTRYPDRVVRFYNAGVSGDSAGAARMRFAEDVRRWNPTVVTLMFGMNDSGRGMYDPAKMADAAYRATIPAREAACRAAYETNLTELVRCIRAELPQARLMFLTPTPYDETAVQTGPGAVPALKGTVASLARFAAFGRKLAAETGSGVVDWTASVSALVAAEQAKDPSFSFVNRDRVHPGAPGHLFLTCEFLKAQGATNPVSDVAISAQDGTVIRADNATVSGFARTADGCAFTVLARALPWVVPPEAEPARAYTPAFAELSREGLAVAGLTPDAVYALRIDGAEVGVWTGAALAHGIDLGRNAKTPQSRQAAEVGRLNAARCAIERDQLRMFAASRRFLRLRGVDPDDFAAVRTYCDGLTEAARKGYFQRRLPDYLRDYGRKDEIERDQDVRWAELQKRRAPQPHRYEVVRLALHAKDGKRKGEVK